MLRFLQGNGFNYEKTAKSLTAHLEWRIGNLPVDEEIEEYANKGFLYFFGRDIRFRPVLHISVKKLIEENVIYLIKNANSSRMRNYPN